MLHNETRIPCRSVPPAGFPMSNLKLAAALTTAVGALCLVLVQFVPWGGIETSGGSVFGFTFPGAQVDSYTWHVDANGESEGWYSGDLDDSDGVGQIRIAIPFLLAGLVVTTLGAILGFTSRGPGGIVMLFGGVIALTGLVLFAMGTDGFYDGEHDWAAAFYLAIAGVTLAILGGTLTVVADNQRTMSMA